MFFHFGSYISIHLHFRESIEKAVICFIDGIGPISKLSSLSLCQAVEDFSFSTDTFTAYGFRNFVLSFPARKSPARVRWSLHIMHTYAKYFKINRIFHFVRSSFENLPIFLNYRLSCLHQILHLSRNCKNWKL